MGDGETERQKDRQKYRVQEEKQGGQDESQKDRESDQTYRQNQNKKGLKDTHVHIEAKGEMERDR